ncbi:hypothetical protein SAMN05216349_1065 [Oribacterium sp. KHPX15]|uniref:hypothetical protein n=1 Tax=Oribacterium sp. KHPX15 TaxID=1855342 RepID=UPI00089B3332|nr:hypothetical protein [Oribacterium sp. KHPX15]SEA17034.1 hypothetical protein SAMN05216349_1065 [Oribacterium sp. KHPX15]
MSYIDKSMLDKLKSWCDGNRPNNQYMLYVNSHDRVLTNATIRKLMNEITNEDVEGEEYISFYSAENFYHNMQKYFFKIDELYFHNPNSETLLKDIIMDIPPSCGWITLIVEDIEILSDSPQIMRELIKTLLHFASRRSNIILIGNGNFYNVFSGCEDALERIICGISAKEEDNIVMIGCYDQETAPVRESVTYENEEEQRDELELYWAFLYEQIDKKYFDYEGFKDILQDTLELLIPRITKEMVYRKDLVLIEKIGAIRHKENKGIEGCKPWEFEASQKIAKGLHEAIVNMYDYDDDENLKKGVLEIEIEIEGRWEHHGAISVSTCRGEYIEINADNVCYEIDDLSEAIRRCTYKGEDVLKLEYFERKDNIENVKYCMDALFEDIKEAADRTVNKVPETKVYRYKGNKDINTNDVIEKDEKTKFKILERNYDIAINQIKGNEKVNSEQAYVDKGKLYRYIVVLDKSRYKINAAGNPEMAPNAQKEYDEFVDGIRHKMLNDKLTILDEGYGTGEDELEWHITASLMDSETDNRIVGIIEIDTCVRIESLE